MHLRCIKQLNDAFVLDQVDSLDTNALVLNMEVKATLLMLPQAIDVSMEVTKLHIFSCLFDPGRRGDSMATVLAPCWIAVKAKMSDDDNVTQLDVGVGNVTLSVSPGTIEMLVNVGRSMSVSDDADDVPEQLKPVADWSHIWKVKI